MYFGIWEDTEYLEETQSNTGNIQSLCRCYREHGREASQMSEAVMGYFSPGLKGRNLDGAMGNVDKQMNSW